MESLVILENLVFGFGNRSTFDPQTLKFPYENAVFSFTIDNILAHDMKIL